ncbi:voltage-gated potassium channel subunit beta [Phytophthora cinnamomi]|uniref:voltage-gated potassium channel subunit beta n=1 Tax=Phytophthora cinnamomi TaxID=4785 RepID=UPI00355A4250|nr:voltage-gated potassium channel subunit beta [Phytophthora cinnamomi]
MTSTQQESGVTVKRSAAKSLSTAQSFLLESQNVWTEKQPAKVRVFKLAVIGLLLFDLIMTVEIFLHMPRIADDNEVECSPGLADPTRITYHSPHNFYSALKTKDLPPPPVFHGDHASLCFGHAQTAAKFDYCLPISGKKDTPPCASADRLDLLHHSSNTPICYASVLHMLLVEVYEELKATENTPFLAFGSLLGAVRDGSMIPFTEDADIGFVEELARPNALKLALRQKGYHMFFMDIWRICVAPTHPLGGYLYDSRLPITENFTVPYVDLYMMKQTDSGDWDLEELDGSNGRILPGNKVQPFSQVSINGMLFDTVADPNFFLTEAYGVDYMTPKPRQTEFSIPVPTTPRHFSQQKSWPVNAGVDKIISALEPVQVSYPTLLTADRIELAGHVALDDASNVTIDFVGATNRNGTEILTPREYYNSTLISVLDNIKILGVSPYEAVTLAGRSRNVAQQKAQGYSSSYSSDSLTLSNESFQVLLNETWTEVPVGEGVQCGRARTCT